ncbi:MAG TPA: DUF748 domain-containing protein [Methylomirabilota bacterium]|nr:DUF748 domain-containing protein [Methylomirabilota bacterium]
MEFPRRRWPRRAAWAGLVVVALVIAGTVASILVEEPLRRRIESAMNRQLDGYTTRIARLDFHPLGFAIDFEGLEVTQNAHPDPPVARIARITASVHWRELLRGAVVADFEMEQPALHVDLTHIRREARDERPIDERGWQQALQAMYPLEINEFRIRDGQLTYVDQGPGEPLRLTAIDARATNIRNIRSPERVYPSELRLQAVVFDRGRLSLEGHADFLADPHPGVLAMVRLDEIELDYFRPVLARYHLALRQGRLAGVLDLEHSPALTAVHIHDAVLRGVEGDYVQTPPAAAKAKQAVQAAAREAEAATNRPDLQLRLDSLRVLDGNLGFVNKTPRGGDYRVFISDLEAELKNFSSHFTEGTGTARIRGRFMGSGRTTVTANFRPERSGPDFDIDVRIEDTELTAMNKLLRAHGKLDVVAGFFSFYSELSVKNQAVTGYVKPFFRNVDVYEPEQDEDKGFFQKVYEKIAGGVAKLLENKPRDEVATQAPVAGPVQDPRASTWQVLVNLVKNAFIEAILPGFDRQLRRS